MDHLIWRSEHLQDHSGLGGHCHVPDFVRLEIVYAVSGRDDVRAVDERAAADVDVVELVLLEDGNLPGVLG
jgi:hypothetical protein